MNRPDEVLREAVGSTRILGGLFALLGGVPALVAYSTRPWSRGIWLQLLMIANAAVLVGPGVWYLFAASYLRRRHAWAAVVSQRVAWGQLAALVLTMGLGVLLPGGRRMMLLPALLAMYFVPALLVTIWQWSRARRAIEQLGAPGTGFQPLHVQPVDRSGGGDRATAPRMSCDDEGTAQTP